MFGWHASHKCHLNITVKIIIVSLSSNLLSYVPHLRTLTQSKYSSHLRLVPYNVGGGGRNNNTEDKEEEDDKNESRNKKRKEYKNKKQIEERQIERLHRCCSHGISLTEQCEKCKMEKDDKKESRKKKKRKDDYFGNSHYCSLRIYPDNTIYENDGLIKDGEDRATRLTSMPFSFEFRQDVKRPATYEVDVAFYVLQPEIHQDI